MGDVVSLAAVSAENEELIKAGKQPAEYTSFCSVSLKSLFGQIPSSQLLPSKILPCID